MENKNKVLLQGQRRTYNDLDGDRRRGKNVYISTYKNDFKGEMAPAAGGQRPRTSWIYSKSYVKMNSPIYNNEFKAKPIRKTEAIRTGSSSGCRRNNPHPLQSFLAWRLTSDGLDKMKKRCKKPADRQMLQKVFLNQLKSTYQVDYNGLQKGVQVKSCHDGDWKPRPEFSPKYSFTSTRHAFRPPRLWPELQQKRTYCRHSRPVHTRAVSYNSVN